MNIDNCSQTNTLVLPIIVVVKMEIDPFDNSTLFLVEDSGFADGLGGGGGNGVEADATTAANLTRRELLEIGVQDMLDGWRYQVRH